MNTPDTKSLRNAFGSFLSGVTVVTTRDENGEFFGFTANSFSSVSLTPPLLLVCPGRFLSSFEKFEACDHFAISVLAEGQEDVSNIFASHKGDRFAKTDWEEDIHGVPLINGAAAHFSCTSHQVIPAGDHIILIGEVQEFDYSGATGLGYASGNYFSLTLEHKAATSTAPGKRAIVGAIIENNGKVLLQETSQGLLPLQFELKDRFGVRDVLTDHLTSSGLNIRLRHAYSVFDDRLNETHYTYYLARSLDDRTLPSCNYYPVHELSEKRFVSDAHAKMLERFALEYETQNFALYVGDERDGDTHDLDRKD